MITQGAMGTYEKIMSRIPELAQKATQRELASLFGVQQPTVSNILKGKGVPRFDTIAKALDLMGARVIFPDEIQSPETAREVCFVNPRIVESGRQAPPPVARDYVAIPLVGQAGAGPGYIAEEALESWVLMEKKHPSVQFRSNLIAVELGRDAESMMPTLHPGDFVLVDRGDIRPSDDDALFLVREPGQEGGAKVKRVMVQRKNGNTLVTYFSDNAKGNPPEIYDLASDFDDDISNAIVGRCVWAWSDLTRK